MSSVKVHIQARDPEGHAKIQKSLKDLQLSEDNWDYLVGDIASWDNQVEVFTKAVKCWGRIDYVFANGGIGEDIWIPNTPSEEEIGHGFVKPIMSVRNL